MINYYGFDLLDEREIPELNTKGRLFRHRKTGAELLSMENGDENKVFGITFRTPPTDSTGVAHIMEHAVLCGSQKYPLKEPFVELLKGSLKTFLNAFTFPDKTCYPVASQNIQDFYNLIDVYVDAVFHPLIPPYILEQEGWHYELDSPDASLVYKGVVFNEMKGAYSDPNSLLYRYAQESLFPDNPYGVDSGGDPRVIPELTYTQFKAFHEKYYHPSNSRIFFYGDDDPSERLRLMDGYLQEYAAIQVDSSIPLQSRFSQPRQMVIPYEPGEEAEGKKGMLVVNWLLPEVGDVQKMLGLAILGHILIGTPASPLRKALIDSGLGEDLAGAGLEEDLRQAYFSTGLKGMLTGEDNRLVDAGKVEALIHSTLEALATQGIDPDTVAASLNTVEFRLRENNTGSFPQGLLLMLRSLSTWLHDSDPIAPLAFEAPLTAIKKRFASGERFFEGLIEEHFLNNPHRTTVILQPEPGLRQREEAAEKDRLVQVRSAMSKAQVEATIENTRRLKKIQETPDSPEALATIPSLELEDLDKENKLIPLELLEGSGCKILYHDIFTNGILYLDLGFDLHTLPQELLPYVPLFGRALLEIGTQAEDFVKLSQRIGRSTGGIRPATFNSLIRGTDRGASWMFLRGKATIAQTDELLAILRDVLLTVRLDNRDRFRQMVLEEKADGEAMLVPSGHQVVNTRLRAKFNEADWAEEQIAGVSYLLFIRGLAQAVESSWPEVLQKLETLRQMLVNRQAMLCNVTVDAASWNQVQPRLAHFLEALPARSAPQMQWHLSAQPQFEGLTIPAQVNYVGKGANLQDLGYQASGAIDVIIKYLRTTWLWERVRVQGGAYGGFCLFNHRSGVFTYLSYRDPNLLSTLDNYDRTAQFLSKLELSQEELIKSIIGAIGDMDAYQLPDARGYTSMMRYLAGDTDESRQVWRDQILSATQRDFRHVGRVLEGLNEQGQVVVLGSQQAIESANAERPGWLQVIRLL